MLWQQLEVVLRSEDVPRMEALLRLAGARAISLAGNGAEDLLEPPPGENPLWSSLVLRALFPPETSLDTVAAALRSALNSVVEMELNAVPDSEWKNAWQRRPGTRRLGERLLLAAADEKLTDFDGVVVRLNLGLAFGTGEHPTTALCLEWLSAELRPDASLIDYGCGSGVLAVAALRLGASRAWAVDIEPQALTATKDNARLNQVEDFLWVGRPDLLPPIQVDVVIANILAGTLEDLVETFARRVKLGGRLVLSGILESQCESVRAAYRDRFGPFKVQVREGWVLVSAPRRQEPL